MKYKKIRAKQLIKYFLISLLLLPSCNNNIRQGGIESLFKSERMLQHTEIQLTNDEFLGLVLQLKLLDNDLIVHEHGRAYSFSIIDINSSTLYSRFARFGQGPNEVLPRLDDLTVFDGNTITAFSVQANALYSFSRKNDFLPKRKIDFGQDRSIGITNMIPISSDRYIAMGVFEEGRYLFLGENGEKISFNFDFPIPTDGTRFTSPIQQVVAFQGILQGRPNRNAFFFAAMTSEVFEIMEIDNDNNLRQVFSFHGEIARFVLEGNTSVAFRRESNVFFVSATSTDNYIYLLYSNKMIGDNIHNAMQSSRVLVFDWQGNPITKLLLDIEVNAIAVSENDEYLFAYANELEKLVRFVLK